MTYLSLGAIFLLPALVVAIVVWRRRRPSRTWWLATAVSALVLVVLTAIFDSVMIAVDLFRFDEAALVGVRLGLAPLEDLAWPLAAALLLPSLWHLLGGEEER